MTPTEKAKAKFDEYAGMDAPDLPNGKVDMSCLQVSLYRWQVRNFGSQGQDASFKGMVEELGELSHALLKHEQGIRGFDDPAKFKEAAGDAIADLLVYATQLATGLRLDIGVLLQETALEVMNRDWVANPADAHKTTGTDA